MHSNVKWEVARSWQSGDCLKFLGKVSRMVSQEIRPDQLPQIRHSPAFTPHVVAYVLPDEVIQAVSKPR